MNKYLIAALFSSMVIPLGIQAQNTEKIPVEINVENIKTNEGNIIVSIFKSEESFNNETPDFEQSFSKSNFKTGIFKTTIHLSPGTYGIAILDDENRDRKMNYNLIGIPNEGYGFSDYEHTGFSKPKFSNFSFKLFNGKKILKAIKLRYF
ncbi:MAG: DUF2141 domain-containing protein [Flavobacteriales bacterium]|nr:DUF2141 domain-containing protein [Flavobacteriales bacterium]